MRKPRTRLFVFLAATALALSGCSGDNQAATPVQAGSEPVEGGNFVFAEVTPISNWQTQEASFYEKANVLNSVLDRLTYFDPESREIVGWIAEDFEANEDATEFVFTIQGGVTFSDGTPLDAEAVKANLDALGHGIEAEQIPANPDFAHYESAEVTGINEVTVTLTEPDANFLRATSSVTAGLVSPETLESSYAEQDSIEAIVASGPFVFESQTIDEEVVFSAREDYAWAPETAANQGAPHLDSFTLRYLPEVSNRRGAIQSDQADLVRGIQPIDEQELQDTGHQVLAAKGLDLTANHLSLRPGSGVVEDPRVRRALTLAIDREEIHSGALSEHYDISASILNRGAPGFVDLSDELQYDPERAKTLLDEAGWEVGEDGVREKDGQQLEVTVTSSNNSVVMKPGLELVEQHWRDIGVRSNGRLSDHAFFVTAMSDDQVEAIGTRAFIYGGLGPKFGSEQGLTLKGDEELSELFTKERAATDTATRDELLAEGQEQIVVDKAYAIPLWDEVQVYGAHGSVHVDFTTGTAPILQGAWKEQE